MYKQFCDLCYDISWICKRGGCLGLKILFSKLIKDENIAKQFLNWIIQNFLIAFRAMLFVFSDFNGHVTIFYYFIIIIFLSSNLNV